MQALGVTATGSGVFASNALGSTDRPTPDSDNTVAFGDLSSDGQEVFRRGLRDGEYTARDPLPSGLADNRYVEYQDALYAVNSGYRDVRKNRLRPVAVDEVESDATVLDFDGLAAQGQQFFRSALENGEHTSEATWVFDFGDDYVRFGDQYYRLNFAHLDVPEYSVSPTRYEG